MNFITKRSLLYFVVLLAGFMVFSENGTGRQTSEIPQSSLQLPGVETYLPLISKYANDQAVIPLALAVMKAESNFEVGARSGKGALGLMQLMPATALEEYRRSGMDASILEIERSLVAQPELNIALGIGYLQYLQERLEGVEDPEKYRKLVIASYNAGMHRVKRSFECKGFRCYKYKANRYSDNFFNKSIRSLPAETREYVQNVEHYYEIYKQTLAL